VLTIVLASGGLVAGGCRSETARPVTLAFVGDMMLGRAVERTMQDRGDWGFAFRPLAERLRSADLTFGNLECVVAAAGPPTTFRADPHTLAALSFAGFDVVGVANNHAADGGPDALVEMLAHLRERGIAPVGVRGGDGAEAAVVLRAGPLRVGFLGYTVWSADRDALPAGPRVAILEPERIARDIAVARPTVDYLVVALHMGQSAPRSSPAEQETARAAIDAGADLVLGGHPHGPQEFERHGRGFIAYSLGDFVFDHPQVSVDGALLEVTLVAARPVRIAYVRTRLNHQFQPEPVEETRWETRDLEGPDRALN
jgi:poly-gamma-glutamate capsule biosynthesis protein CapA/YwtB (metallophosphatase superfamily)